MKNNIKYLQIFFFLLVKTLSSQDVNKFTGTFSYGKSLLHVPSNRGTGVSIDISYGAGIGVNQSASEIGLGWNINAGGAIYRNVSGIPDDVKDFNIVDFTGTISSSIGTGALYMKNTAIGSDNKTYDFSRTKRGLDTTEFTYPDFDNFSVVGPAFSGQMQLSYYNYYKFYNLPISGVDNQTGVYTTETFRKPQFHFTGDFADTLTSRYYPNQINSSTPIVEPTIPINGLGYTNSTEPFIGKHLSGSTISNQNFDNLTGRLASTNFVEYFTNAEIDAANSAGFPSSSNLSNFIDYKIAHNRDGITNTVYDFPADGIGYFRITASNGLTYHFRNLFTQPKIRFIKFL
jgi:hypothetical protein